MAISNLTISYPDFKLNEVINPDEFDTNNADIKKKIDQIITVINQITDSTTSGTSGADTISLTAITPYTSTKLQAFLKEVIAKLKSTGGSAEIGTPVITGVTGTTVKDQLASLKSLLDGHATRLTTVESDISGLKTRATNVETRATNLESRATSLETRASNLENNKTDKTTTTTLTNRVSSLETGKTDVSTTSALDTRVGNLENNKADKTTTNSLTTRVSSLETGKTDVSTTNALTTRVSTVETDKADKSTTYTKTEVNTSLSAKTDKAGNHEGTWQGLNPSDFDSGAMRVDLDNHIADKANPHATTAAQVGAYSKTESDANYTPKSHIGTGGSAHATVTPNGSAGFMSGSDKAKLDGVATGANNYVHPGTHPATMIVEDANNRFVTDSQINSWNNRVDKSATGLQTIVSSLKTDNPWYEASRNTAQSIPSKSWTRIVPNSVIGNNGGGTHSSGIYYAPYTGYYIITMYCNLSSVVAGSISYLGVFINGGLSDAHRMVQKANESIYDGQMNGTVMLYLTSGTSVQWMVYNGDSVARDCTSSYQRIYMMG